MLLSGKVKILGFGKEGKPALVVAEMALPPCCPESQKIRLKVGIFDIECVAQYYQNARERLPNNNRWRIL